MIPTRIRNQLQLLAVLPALIMFVLLLVALTWQRFEDVEEQLDRRGQFMARHLALASEYGVLSGNQRDLRKQAELALKDPAARYVLFRDRGGDVLLFEGERRDSPPQGHAKDSGNKAVIDWITDDLMSDYYKAVEAALRQAVTDPQFDIRAFWRELVTKYIEDDSETDDLDSIEMSRRGFGI